MPAERESSLGVPPFPPVEVRLSVANQLVNQLATKCGRYSGQSNNGRPKVLIGGGIECVVPLPEHLFDYIHADVMTIDDDGLHHIRVIGTLPLLGHPDSSEVVGPVYCAVRLSVGSAPNPFRDEEVPERDLETRENPHDPTISAELWKNRYVVGAILIASAILGAVLAEQKWEWTKWFQRPNQPAAPRSAYDRPPEAPRNITRDPFRDFGG